MPPADPYPSTYRPYPGVPTAITGATIFDGEGGRIENGTIVLVDGRIQAVGGADTPIPEGATRIDGRGRWVTPGVIDVHSPSRRLSEPRRRGAFGRQRDHQPVRPEVWAEHSVWPQDPGFSRALANGGITTLQVLPGSANLFGGRGVTLRNVPARTMQAMRFPGAPRGLKMACGENPKRVYGGRNQMPQTRMGNVALMRATWQRAVEYRERRAREPQHRARPRARHAGRGARRARSSSTTIATAPTRWRSCSTWRASSASASPAFHHAVEAYKIADLLRESGTCAAMWADWWGFKMEAYDAINENIPLVHNAGACAIVHSDDANGIQRLNQEAAKALADGRRMGIDITDEVAWRWLAINPATALGIADRDRLACAPASAPTSCCGTAIRSASTRGPQQVWIDGALLYDMNDPRRRPVSDFELGQPGEGDVK